MIDLQKGVIARPTAHPITDVVARSAALAAAFRRHGLPVVLVTVAGGSSGRTDEKATAARAAEGASGAAPAAFPEGWDELVPELGAQPEDVRIVKRTWGAFTGTGLDAVLAGLGVTQLVLTGVATSIGVESTARHAHELGYHVSLAVDAMTDRVAEAHENSVTRIFPRLGETASTAEILGALG